MVTTYFHYILNPGACIIALKQLSVAIDTSKVAPTLLFLFITLVAYRFIYALYLSPLRKIPGPLLGKLTSLRTNLRKIRGLSTKTECEDTIKYGDIYMCMPNSVNISNPDDIRTVFGNPAINKSPLYKLLKITGVETTTSMQDNKDADIRHRQMLPYFQHRYLSKMQDIIMDQGIHSIKSKWDSLLEQSTTGKVEVNYSNDITTAVFSVLSRLVFGRTIIDDERANDASTSWIERSFRFTGVRAMLQILPSFLAKALFWPWEHHFTRVSDLAHESIAIRKRLMGRLEAEGRMDEKPADLLQALIEAEDSETNTKMNYNEIHAESLSIMFAGSDTTAVTTIWTVHLLTLYPHHYRRAVEEARSRYSQDHVITYNECRETLPFVEACIYESLRLKPGIGGMLSRVSPKGGIVLQGHFIPENIIILVNMGHANHHEKHWDRPYEYDPTRFIKDKEAQRNILSFSHGKRACPGRYLALWEIMTIIPNLLKDYDFELPADYTHLGPSVLDERGLPKTMDANLFITYAPSNPKRDCRLRISKAIIKKA